MRWPWETRPPAWMWMNLCPSASASCDVPEVQLASRMQQMPAIGQTSPLLVGHSQNVGGEDLASKKTRKLMINYAGLIWAATLVFYTTLAPVYRASSLDHFPFKNVFDNKLNERLEKHVRTRRMRCDRKSYGTRTWKSRRLLI